MKMKWFAMLAVAALGLMLLAGCSKKENTEQSTSAPATAAPAATPIDQSTVGSITGVVKFTGGGSSKTNIYGALLAGHQSIDEISAEDMVLGGSASIQYDFCALNSSNQPRPPSVISFRELMY